MMQGTQLTAPVIAGFLIDFFGVRPPISRRWLARAFRDHGAAHPRFRPASRSTPANQLAQPYRRLRISLAHADYFVFVSARFFCCIVWFFPADTADFCRYVFKVGARGLGMLYAAPAIGALIGSRVVLAAGDIERKGAMSIIVTLMFAFSLGFLGMARWFWIGLLALAILGISDAISVAIRRTVVQFSRPTTCAAGRPAS